METTWARAVQVLHNFRLCCWVSYFLLTWQLYVRERPLSVTVLPSFVCFVILFAWWWPYWPKHVTNFCQTIIVFAIKVVNWVRIAFFPMLAAKAYMSYLLLYLFRLYMRNITNYEVSCCVVFFLLSLFLL
jgi:hypothetical protein